MGRERRLSAGHSTEREQGEDLSYRYQMGIERAKGIRRCQKKRGGEMEGAKKNPWAWQVRGVLSIIPLSIG